MVLKLGMSLPPRGHLAKSGDFPGGEKKGRGRGDASASGT